MDYCYKIKDTDSFCHYQMEYIKHNNLIVGLKRVYNNGNREPSFEVTSFDCDTLEFSQSEILQFVDFDKLKTVSNFYEHFTFLYLIDMENKQYTKSSKFPYFITEIDGNAITLCKKDDEIYIFHSHTENYDTGVFIFNIKTNTFDIHHFQDKEMFIVDCYSFNDEIIITGEDGLYNYQKDSEPILIVNMDNVDQIVFNDDHIITLCGYDPHMLLMGSRDPVKFVKQVAICPAKDYILFLDIYDDKLVAIIGRNIADNINGNHHDYQIIISHLPKKLIFEPFEESIEKDHIVSSI